MATHLVALSALLVIYASLSGFSQFYALISDMWPLFFAGTLAILQFLWLRRSWGITLRLWLPLALLGVIAGEIAFELLAANVEYPFPPKLWSESPNRMPQPEHVMQLKYALYTAFRFLLLWSTPLIFQWLALRKRFQGHSLWLIAAVAHAPLTFFITEHGGLMIHALKLFDKFTAISLIRDTQPLGSILYVLDWATPSAIMGLALYVMLARSAKVRDLRS